MAKDIRQMNDAERTHFLSTHKYLRVAAEFGYYSKEKLAGVVSANEEEISKLKVRQVELEAVRDCCRRLLADFDSLPRSPG